MKIEQVYTNCIAHAAYYIESDGEAAIFDPLRDIDAYLARAKKDEAQIVYVFETHFHADFVSGHLGLREATGAQIVFGPTAQPSYDATIAEDGEVFNLGRSKIKVLHTPGHTMESSTYLIIDEEGKEQAIISGDTLLIGDVGRPDLVQLVKSEITEDILARHLYRSLRNKILPLPDHLIVYPNHGAGSACGKNMSKETYDTLGNQKATNYALRADMTEDEFVRELLTGLVAPPQYFPNNVLMNVQGYESLSSVLQRANTALTIEQFLALETAENALLLDTRDADVFAEGFIPGSLNIGLNGQFAAWVGELIREIKQPILLITEKGKEYESIVRLSRVGYDNAIGYLEGGFEVWKDAARPIQKVKRITPLELQNLALLDDTVLLDVRKDSEYDSEHIKGSVHIPLNVLESKIDTLLKNKDYIIYCAGGYRSMIAASIFAKHNMNSFVDVVGGYQRIVAESTVERTEYHCPTTML